MIDFFPRKSKKKQWAKTFQNNTTWSHKTAERGSMGPKNRRTISLHHWRIKIWQSFTEFGHQPQNLAINPGIWTSILDSGHQSLSLDINLGTWTSVTKSGHQSRNPDINCGDWDINYGIWSSILESRHQLWSLDINYGN